MRRLLGAIGLTCLMLLAAPAGGASARSLTSIASPRTGQIVGNGHVRIVVRSRANLGAMRIRVNGRNVTRYFHRSAGAYRATLRLGHGLYRGVDDLFVKTDRYKDFDRVSFIVARRARGLLTLGRVHTPGDGAPAGVSLREGRGTTLRAWVNGHRDDRAFEAQWSDDVGRLGANDWLRPGRNEVVALAYRTSVSGRSAVFDVERRTFSLKPGLLIASAGRDRVVSARDSTALHASAFDLGRKDLPRNVVSYRWRIVRRPRGGRPILRHGRSANAEFEATAPGDYLIATTAYGASGAVSVDTLTVAVQADVPPIGWRLDTASDDLGTIKLNGQPVPGTTCSDPTCLGGTFATYAVFNRQTLQLATAGYVQAHGPLWLTTLINLMSKYKRTGLVGDPTYLVVMNIPGAAGLPPELKQLLEFLGSGNLIAPPTPTSGRPISVVGVPGSAPGSAFISASYRNDVSGCLCAQLANMSGYLRLNPRSATGGYFEFVRTDQVEFNTDAATTPGQVVIKVGNRTYARNVPTDGSSGFFVVVLNSQTLEPDKTDLVVTNNPDRSENPNEEVRLRDTLSAAAERNNLEGEQLVLLQSFGRPRGLDGAWLQAGWAIRLMRGNDQLFAQLNQGNAAEPRQGGYAFVGRSAMGAPAAESTGSLTGLPGDGRLRGLLSRGRDNQYLPLLADPAGTINFGLVNIVNRPTAVNNSGFPYWTPREAAAVNFLARNPNVMGLCTATALTCDVRKAYYEKYNADWTTILTRLEGATGTEACANGGNLPDGTYFTADDCNSARRELRKEIGERNTVATYFSRLQAPFGSAQVGALADIAKISDEIATAVKPPPANNAVSHALNIVSFLLKIAGAAGTVVNPGIGTAANGLSAVFGLAAYVTNDDGTPDLVGPTVRTEAAQLGVDLVNRYQRVLSYATTEAKIIMSDGTKLSDVAAVANSDDKWELGDKDTTVARIGLATRQAIYQALVPVAYPVIYDLGSGITHATQWYCSSPFPLVDKNLFQDTGEGAEVLYKVTDPKWGLLGKIDVMAIGAVKTVGSLKSAYVPAPPDTLTKTLFADPGAGGVGLYKLAFYTPEHFRLFPEVLQQDLRTDGNRGYPTCQGMPNPPGNAG